MDTPRLEPMEMSNPELLKAYYAWTENQWLLRYMQEGKVAAAWVYFWDIRAALLLRGYEWVAHAQAWLPKG